MVRIREDKKRSIREDEEDMTLQDSIVYGLEQEGVAAHVVDEGKDFGVMIDGSNIFITWDVGYFDMNSGRCQVFFLAYDRDTNTKIYDGEKVTEMYDAILDYCSFSDDMFESKKRSNKKSIKESEYNVGSQKICDYLQEAGYEATYVDSDGTVHCDQDVSTCSVRPVGRGGTEYVVEFSSDTDEVSESTMSVKATVNLVCELNQRAVKEAFEDMGLPYNDCDDDYNEDHSMDFDDEDSPYYLGGGKGW